MSFGLYYPNKAGFTTKWEPQFPPDVPLQMGKDQPEQVTSVLSGGEIIVQNKGAARRTWSLPFTLMSDADRASLETFWDTVGKSFKSFEMDDGTGTLFTVRIMNALEFEKFQVNNWSTTLELREE
ncbi:MAG: hypothetical protein G3M70_07315 [Candidatus Nitronauta litoralis]|uniref:Phage tail protein n=1 Tax=Candidatus Nitronauta litoralis TaxID=2705533 RepID=A0A7T0BVG8_9BACT|nr:MAG: hypothetical protein G3M70_07315 [Candidatus Nitronauta litoralis]